MPESGPTLLRPMLVDDLASVLEWRNDPAVRRCMLTQHEISMDEHRLWFERTSGDVTRRNLVVEEGGVPLGVVQLTGVSKGGIADWGFYLAAGAKPGAGKKLGIAALDYAFGSLELHKVCGQVLDYNERSIRFHLRLGFQKEGILREHFLVNGVYRDLLCFGLLQCEYSYSR